MADVTVAWSQDRQRWVVYDNGEPVSIHELKQGAEKEGRRYAKSVRPSTLAIQNKQGRTSYSQNYE